MIRQALLVPFLFCTVILFGQKRNKHNSPIPPSPYEKNAECRKTNKFSLQARLKNYPFDKAQAVLIVSFNYSTHNLYITYKGDTTGVQEGDGSLPIKGDTLSYIDLSEKVFLNEKQIDSLTYILYNYDYKGETNFVKAHNCFDPHNAIVFLDEHGKMFEYIEICFLCSEIKVSSEKIQTGHFCSGKYDLLRSYFKNTGLTIGVDKK